MLNQFELIDKVLKLLEQEGILKHLIFVGSWCLYFYKYHFKDTEILTNIRTMDIDIDVTFLHKKKVQVDIPKLLEPLGFDIQFHHSGSIALIHPAIKIDFLLSEKGKGLEECVKLKGCGINCQPIRFLDLLEKELITVNYKGLMVNVPHPAYYALHKLIISQRRPKKNEKSKKDIVQGIEVLRLLVEMNKMQDTIDIFNSLTKKQQKYIKIALGNADEVFITPDLEECLKNFISS